MLSDFFGKCQVRQYVGRFLGECDKFAFICVRSCDPPKENRDSAPDAHESLRSGVCSCEEGRRERQTEEKKQEEMRGQSDITAWNCRR